MTKDVVAKTGEYTNRDGETKSEWIKIGVILSNQNGEYMLLDPAVNLAGVLTKQNMLAAEKRKQGDEKARTGTSVMCSIFDKDQPQAPAQQAPSQPSGGSADDDIPFSAYQKGWTA